jgi:adenylate cyclase
MAQEGFKRKLTAILSADVIGYSRLMRNDEEATVRDIAAHRVLISEIIKKHHGRVVDSPGDNILAEFASVVDAVNGSIKTQQEIKKRNAVRPDDRRMVFRIGINLGDVIEEEERIYGDGVNIAARVEGLASAGGIAISGTVYEHIKDKLSLGYHYLGKQDVKNIPESIRVYRLLPDADDAGKMIGEQKPKSIKVRYIAYGALALIILAVGALIIWDNYIRVKIEPASVEKMAYPLPEKPSIAVLPFDNLSGDPNQDYISNGISENIISALSKIGEIFVIARNSTFAFKGKAVKVHQVAEELGVRYVLEGSVQKSIDKIRITAQLIDATTGYHLWSEKYDREIKNFFQILDEITQKVVIALQSKLTHGEQVRRWYGTTNFEAWGFTVRGWSIFETYTKANNERARELFQKAIKIDPSYAFARVALSWTYFIDARFGFTKNPAESLRRAVQNAQKAQVLDDSLPELHALWNSIYLLQRQHEKAIAEGQRSIELGPNSALSYILFAQTMNYAGKFDDTLALAKQAIRLSPYYPAWYLYWLGMGYRNTGRYQDSIEVFNRLLDRSQEGESPVWLAHIFLAGTYAKMEQYDEASIHVAEAKKAHPDLSLKLLRMISPYKDPAILDSFLDSLSKSGLK